MRMDEKNGTGEGREKTVKQGQGNKRPGNVFRLGEELEFNFTQQYTLIPFDHLCGRPHSRVISMHRMPRILEKKA
jgi:hypothetical protein